MSLSVLFLSVGVGLGIVVVGPSVANSQGRT